MTATEGRGGNSPAHPICQACDHVADAIASRNLLAAELVDNGATFRQVAEWAGVSPQTVHNWVTAHREAQ